MPCHTLRVSIPDGAPLRSSPRWAPRRLFQPFLMMRLNLVGWSALGAAGVVLAIPELILGWNPGLALAAGLAASFAAVWARDYQKWRRSVVSVSVPLPDEDADVLAASLRGRGIDVVYEPRVLDPLTGELSQSGRFVCRAPYVSKLEAALGIPEGLRFRRRRMP